MCIGEYGVKLPLYFPFMSSYWFEDRNQDKYDYMKETDDFLKNDSFERDPNDLYASVKIRNLTKVIQHLIFKIFTSTS